MRYSKYMPSANNTDRATHQGNTTMNTCTNCGNTHNLNRAWCSPCMKAHQKAQRAKANEAKQTATYGVEIECSGLTIRQGMDIVARVTGGVESAYHRVTDRQGRHWRVVSDCSIAGHDSCEVVTPVMRYGNPEDMALVQEVTRELRRAGGRASGALSCGQHVHVSLPGLTAEDAAKIGRLATAVEETVMAAIGVHQTRARWCSRSDERVVRGLRRVSDSRSLQRCVNRQSRYHAVNLHAFAAHGTVEFRWADGTLHAGKVRSNVELAVAFVVKAAGINSVSTPRVDVSLEGMVKVLNWLGIKDKVVREHLTAGFGTAARRAA